MSARGHLGLLLSNGGANYLDPSKKGAALTLSNGNKTVTGTNAGNWQSVFGIDSAASGYFEVFVNDQGTSSFCFVGVGNTASPTNSYCGSDANGWGYGLNGTAYHNGAGGGGGPAVIAGDVIGIAIKGSSMWVSKNGVWYTGDPSAGTGALFTGLSATLYPILSAYYNGQMTLRLLASEFSYPIPTGIGAWN